MKNILPSTPNEVGQKKIRISKDELEDLNISEAMNFESFAKNKGWKKVTIKMMRVPVYARIQPGSYKETTKVAYVEDLNSNRTGVAWGNVLGTLIKDRNGEWAAINTNKAKYDVIEIKT